MSYKKETRLFGGGSLSIFKLCYTLVPPPCSAGIIMTTTIMTAITSDIILFDVHFDMKDCYTVNILPPIYINKELCDYF